MNVFNRIYDNQEVRQIFNGLIIGITILDIIILTAILFVQVSSEIYNIILIFDLLVCILLISQFIYDLYRSENRREYIKHNWFDIIGFIPEIFLGGYATILRYFRLIKILSLFRNTIRNFFGFIGKANLEYGIITLIFILISGAAVFYFFESRLNPNVNSIDDALWYILITITTVGYGDISPQSVGGRLATVIIIIAGITFVSYVAIRVTEMFFDRSMKEEYKIEDKIDEINQKIDKMSSELSELKEIIKKEK